jgi:RNA polymerase sigma factor FliA
MAAALRQIVAKSTDSERHASCIPNGVADGEHLKRPRKRNQTMRKPPTKEWIGTQTEQVESATSIVANFSREPEIEARLETQPMPAAQSATQLSFSTLSQTIEINAAYEASHPDQARFAQRDRVVLEHLPLVRAIAVRVHENLPVHVDLDDLIHAGIMGLFDAATKFDTDKNVAFSSYAKHRIKGAILDSLRQLDWASRDLRRRHKQVEAVTRDLAAELQRNPTEQEIADKMGVEVDRWRQMMIDLRNVGLVSASTRANENEDLPAPDFPTSPDHHPDSICAREELKTLLKTALHTLPERYQRVVMLYYSNELTMKEIGNMLGINESRVSQIHKAALEKMANALGQAGISSAAAF